VQTATSAAGELASGTLRCHRGPVAHQPAQALEGLRARAYGHRTPIAAPRGPRLAVSLLPPGPCWVCLPRRPATPQHPPANWPTWPTWPLPPPRPAGSRPPGCPPLSRRVPASAAAEPAGVPSRSPCSGSRRHAYTPRAHCLPCIPLRLSSRIPRRVRPGSPLHRLTDHIHRVEIGPNLLFPKTR